MSKRADTSMQLAYDELNRAFHRAYDRAEELEAENARLRRLSVRIFDECPNPECENGDLIEVYHPLSGDPPERSVSPCPSCDGKGVVLRDGIVHWHRLYDKVEMLAFPASWMEAE